MNEDLPIEVIMAVKIIVKHLVGGEFQFAHISNTGTITLEPGKQMYTPIAQDMMLLRSGKVGRLDPAGGNRQFAVDMLIGNMPLEFSYWYVARRKEYGDDWWLPDGWHFSGGMAIRNLLRQHGFDEKYFGIANLDDIYIGLVEEAMRQCGNG